MTLKRYSDFIHLTHRELKNFYSRRFLCLTYVPLYDSKMLWDAYPKNLSNIYVYTNIFLHTKFDWVQMTECRRMRVWWNEWVLSFTLFMQNVVYAKRHLVTNCLIIIEKNVFEFEFVSNWFVWILFAAYLVGWFKPLCHIFLMRKF